MKLKKNNNIVTKLTFFNIYKPIENCKLIVIFSNQNINFPHSNYPGMRNSIRCPSEFTQFDKTKIIHTLCHLRDRST